MKKVIFENGLRAFLVTFCLLLLGAVGASAQGTKLTSVAAVPGVGNPPTPAAPVYDIPQGIFVNTLQAQLLLDAAMANLKDNFMMPIQTSDPSTFAALQIKYRYYRSVRDRLDQGATVPNAIAAGLWIFLEAAELNMVPITTQQTFKNEVINLLHG